VVVRKLRPSNIAAHSTPIVTAGAPHASQLNSARHETQSQDKVA